MKIYYSAGDCNFYLECMKDDYVTAGSWPDDLVGVSESEFSDYTRSPLAGKIRGSDEAGRPVWVDLPEPTQDALINAASDKKKALLNSATVAIAPLQDAVELGIATDVETTSYAEWRKYRVLLNRTDTSKAPDIDWPVQPTGAAG